MRTVEMAQPGMDRPSARAINPNYRSTTDILSRPGGIVWGFILLFVGALWFAGTAGWIPVGAWFNLVIPFLVIVAGLYILVTKLMQ
jgi:hypothetical protein